MVPTQVLFFAFYRNYSIKRGSVFFLREVILERILDTKDWKDWKNTIKEKFNKE